MHFNRLDDSLLNTVLQGNNLERLKALPDNCIDCVVTSPSYYGLRDYGTATWIGGDKDCTHSRSADIEKDLSGCKNGQKNGYEAKRIEKIKCKRCGAIRQDHQVGIEPTPEAYVKRMVEIFEEVRRVLKPTGTLWLNLGDSYCGIWGNYGGQNRGNGKQRTIENGSKVHQKAYDGKDKWKPPTANKMGNIKPKDLIGIPWMVAFALRDAGWYLRSSIQWCLSGGVWLYVKSQKGIMPMMVKDMTRLKPSTVQLWNGTKWTYVLGWGQNTKNERKLEIVLRSGERIGCTENHRWPTNRGIIKAADLKSGDIIKSCILPDSKNLIPAFLSECNDIFWFIGLYIAEGSKSGNNHTLQISGHKIKDYHRIKRIAYIAEFFGGSSTYTIKGNQLDIRISGKIINAIIDLFVSGNTAYRKCFSPGLWNMPNWVLKKVMEGYLSGDGHFDEKNNRWRLGFCRNYNLERDLRILAARLGAILTLNPGFSKSQTGIFPSYKGEWKWINNKNKNEKSRTEIIEVRNSRARTFWDISVSDKPNLFSLASGVLTHNCKPNPMPESVTDRPTKAHEDIFLLTKSPKYFYDAEAIRTVPTENTIARMSQQLENQKGSNRAVGKTNGPMKAVGPGRNIRPNVDIKGGNEESKKGIAALPGRTGSDTPYTDLSKPEQQSGGANKKTVWSVDQDATWKWFYENFPEELVDPLYEQFISEGFNKTDVWEVSTKPFKEAHFATYPEDLISPCIKAGSSEYGCCSNCGNPYVRVTEPVFKADHTEDTESAYDENMSAGRLAKLRQKARESGVEYSAEKRTIGWSQNCKCEGADIIPAVILDPFDGAGTTRLASKRLGRNYLGIELNPAYIKIGDKRMVDELGGNASLFENKDFYHKL